MTAARAEADRGHLLVVDDTREHLRLLVDMLSEQGYKVRPAVNGRRALTVARAMLPELILLDVTMPDMSGYQVCEQLKVDDDTRAIPVIFISALNEGLDRVKAFAVGGADYITKPVQVDEVLARVEHQLRLRSLQKQLAEKDARLLQERQKRRQAEADLLSVVQAAGGDGSAEGKS